MNTRRVGGGGLRTWTTATCATARSARPSASLYRDRDLRRPRVSWIIEGALVHPDRAGNIGDRSTLVEHHRHCIPAGTPAGTSTGDPSAAASGWTWTSSYTTCPPNGGMVTAPRAARGSRTPKLVARCTKLRDTPHRAIDQRCTRAAMKALGRRIEHLDPRSR